LDACRTELCIGACPVAPDQHGDDDDDESRIAPVCTENPIRVDDVMESLKLAE